MEKSVSFLNFRDMSKKNISCYVSRVRMISFCELTGNDDINIVFDDFVCTLLGELDDCCPFVRRHGNGRSKRWITPQIKVASQNLKDLHWLVKITNDDTIRSIYKKAKYEYNKLLKFTKLNYHQDLIEQSTNRNRTIWNLVNIHTGRKKNTVGNISLNIDNSVYTEPDCLSEIFCDYFAGVADKIVCENFGTSKPSICTSPNMVPSTFFFMPVTKHDVLLVISQLKNGKSTGVDGISAKLIKYIADDVSEYLAELLNLSVRAYSRIS